VSRPVFFDSPNPNFSYAANSLLILIPLQRNFFSLVSCCARDSPNPKLPSGAILRSFRAVLVILQPLVNLRRQNSARVSCCARNSPNPNSSSAAKKLHWFRAVLVIPRSLIPLLRQFFARFLLCLGFSNP
jgi:hypothetical protein